MKNNSFSHLDESQQAVVRAEGGRFLVLAPPGCGKTHVLTERIRHAHAEGTAYADMLCLTFTNRAAREMMGRISQHISEADDLHVGSIHRFCSRFLISEGHTAADTSIIDDEEAVSIIADYMHEDADHVMGDYRRYQVYQQVIFFAHLMEQVEQGHDPGLYLHPEVFSEGDRAALRRLCLLQKREYGRESLLEFYRYADQYRNDAFAPGVSHEMRSAITQLTLKMYYAYSYTRYKAEHHLLDFEDLLLRTYNIYRTHPECKRYPWVQVDEVQDLNALQMAIIDELSAEDATTVYFGDEQQAIFSFMGAKLETLDVLRMRCKGHIHHLRQNHRSPSYLLDALNRYAREMLNIHPDLLPTTPRHDTPPPGALRVLYSQTDAAEVTDVAHLAEQLLEENPTETTAIIVNTNREADNISAALTATGVPHFKVSGRDVFNTKEMKLLMAHLSVLHHEHAFMPWTRLLTGMRVFSDSSLARRFVFRLQQLAISPADLLTLSGTDTYTQLFVRQLEEGDLVVFDTETTGVDTQHDDIIEIAAIRLHHGQPTTDVLDLYLHTDRSIPIMLGDKPNPMCAIYKEKERAGQLLEPAEALRQFLAFIGQSALLGHNVQFDYHIVDAQLRRHLGRSMDELPNAVIDSLKLMRLLEPHLPSYKLERLLELYALEGQNSHRAIDDVGATISLTLLCHRMAKEKTAAQQAFLSHAKVQPLVEKLRDNYRELYLHARARLYKKGVESCALIEELTHAYQTLLDDGLIRKIAKLDYVTHYVEHNLLTDEYHDAPLAVQLSRAVLEMNTMKEADFCNTQSVKERLYVTTVHKAKGLEFSNVIVYDVSRGRYPGTRSTTQRQVDEDKRRLYVAMSRAQKRLIFSYPLQSIDRYGQAHNKELSPFLTPLLQLLD